MKINKEDLLITHLFDAPREIVFMAWTDPEQLKMWYGAEGSRTEFKNIEVKTGGEFHVCVNDLVDGESWTKGIYMEVSAPEKLTYYSMLSNANGDLVTAMDAGKSADWPEAITTTVTFTAVGNQTMIVLHQTLAEAEARRTGYYDNWYRTFDRLAARLKES